ncbi:MAG TPA: hypothetical protein DFR83_00230 [Deltaproteobacteria bacterium]|nr:hypothetical protein [Deltaproteobacteria bacterium]
MRSHFHRALGISLTAPKAWTAAATEVFPLLLLAPLRDTIRSNVGFSRSAVPPTATDAVDRILAATRKEQEADYSGFVERSVESLQVDGFPTILQTYRWQPIDAPEPLHQWFGLIHTASHGIIEINAFTVASHAGQVTPTVRAIVDSIRFIPFSN